MSVSLQLFSYEVLICVINREKVYLDICTSYSVRKKNDLVTQTDWNVTFFSRPVAAPPSGRKKCGVRPKHIYDGQP